MSAPFPKSVRARVASVVRTDAVTLIALLMTIIAAWCFLEVVDEVIEGDTQRLDEWVVRSMRRKADSAAPLGPRWLFELIRDLTALGGTTVLVLVITVVSGYLWIRRAYHSMWLVLAASLGGLVLGAVLKGIFQRPRPTVVPALTHVAFSSFPSGHTLNAAVVYLTLGLLLAQLSENRRLKVYFVVVACLVTMLVGLSRVYLGAHYPSDVAGGWSAGATWAGICWIVARRLQRAGTIESV